MEDLILLETLLTSSLIFSFCACLLVLYWYQNNWENHPVIKLLKSHTRQGQGWKTVASSINIEFRRIDKFTTGQLGRRVIVTDSWIILTATYYVHIAHQSDVHLTLEKTEEHEMALETSVSVQYLNIVVRSINEHVKPFKIR